MNLEQMANQLTDEEIQFVQRYVRTDEGARKMVEAAIESNKALSAQCEGKLRTLYECHTTALERLIEENL